MSHFFLCFQHEFKVYVYLKDKLSAKTGQIASFALLVRNDSFVLNKERSGKAPPQYFDLFFENKQYLKESYTHFLKNFEISTRPIY